MEEVIVFATSYDDAAQFMQQEGLEFDQTTWVMNVQLLDGSKDYTGYAPRYTETFRMMPAYAEAVTVFGEEAADGA